VLTAGAGGTYYFHYIASAGRGGGGGGFLPIDVNSQVRNYPPQYLAAQVITKEWVQPVDAVQKLFKVASDVKDGDGNILVTAYAVERPDGQWSVMLINKDPDNDHTVNVAFADSAAKRTRHFTGKVDRITFGPTEYKWHDEAGGHADPDGPAAKSTVQGSASAVYQLPKASIIVLRGRIAE